MTGYDRGEFVKVPTMRIETCVGGTFILWRFKPNGGCIHNTFQEDAMAFSSASDMLRFLESEFSAGGPQPPEE